MFGFPLSHNHEGEPVLSRHRLPEPLRSLLTLLWLLPLGLLVMTIVLRQGVTLALLDPRFLLLVGLMLLPAWYVWQEGVDVLPRGIRRRVHVPRYLPYKTLSRWRCDRDKALQVWDVRRVKVLECRPGHLSDLPLLVAALRQYVHPQQGRESNSTPKE